MHNRREKPGFHLYIDQSKRIDISRNVYVRESAKTEWEGIKAKEEGHYYFQRLNRALIYLATTPGPRQVGMQIKVIGPITLTFRIDESNGDIEVYRTQVDDSPEFSAKQTPGLYRVNSGSQTWDTERDTDVAMEFSHHWGDNEHNAAIAGKFKSKEDAGKLIPDHLINAYTISNQNSKSSGNHYSLYWLNNDFKNTKHVDSIVHHLREAQKSKRRVRWLIHGEATTVFAQALDLVSKTGELKTETETQTQRVYFSNPRGPHSQRANLLKTCEAANIGFAGLQLNEHDILHNHDARMKKLTDFGNIQTGVMGLMSGAGAAFGTDNIIKAYDAANAANSSILSSVGFGSAAAIIATCVVGAYGRSLWEVGNTTLGKGNQQWTGN
jgi:hypothetical protein